jgi:hypothetical protein
MVICVLRVSLIVVSPFPCVSLHVNLRRTHGTSGTSWTINDSGLLVSLNLAENQLGPIGAKCIAKVLPKW